MARDAASLDQLREKLARLELRRSKLSDDEVADLHEVFPIIIAANHDRVWERLRRRGLEEHEAEEIIQESLSTLYEEIVEAGFPENLPATLLEIVEHRFLHYVRDLPPVTAAHRERAVRRFFERLDGTRPSIPIQAIDTLASGFLRPREETGTAPLSHAELAPASKAPPPASVASKAVLDLPPESRGLPFEPPEQVQASAVKAVPTFPIGDDSTVPFPRLKMQEYASLRAELAVHPERSEEIRLRYHVLHTATLEALDDHWRKHFAEHPGARSAFDTMLATYAENLRVRRK